MKAIGRENLKHLRNFMEKNSLDAVLFVNSDPIFDVNIRYFSGFVQEEPGTYSCILAITRDERILFVPPLEFNRAEQQADVEEIINTKEFDYSYSKAVSEKIKKFKKIGIVKDNFPLKFYESLRKRTKCKFVDIENFLAELRSVKLKKEIELLKKSARISDGGIKIIEETLNEKKKITEKELVERIERELKNRGAEDFAFKTIVTSGRRSSFVHPHPFSSNQTIKSGLGYADFGAVYQGYYSDITVPFVKGEIDKKEKKTLEITEEAFNLAIESIEIGLPTWKLFNRVNDFLKSKGFELQYALGHGLGLTVHDVPSISRKPTDKLQLKEWKEIRFKENMVFAIEPGVYTATSGCRLENDVLLTKKGPKFLTHARIIEL